MVTLTRPAVAPERSLNQRLIALQKANRVRSGRAALKQQIACGQRSVFDLLLDPPQMIETMKISTLLLSMPKYGRVKVGVLLRKHEISPNKTVGGLTARQRFELVGVLRDD